MRARIARLAHVIHLALFESKTVINFEDLIGKSEGELAKIVLKYVKPLDVPRLYSNVSKVKRIIEEYKVSDRSERLRLAGKLVSVIEENKNYFKNNVILKYPKSSEEMMRIMDRIHPYKIKVEL